MRPVMRATCASRQTSSYSGSVAIGFTSCSSPSVSTCRSVFPRSKYNDVDKARLAYAKQRKHTASSTRKLRRRLLKLLSKLLSQWYRFANCIALVSACRQNRKSVSPPYVPYSANSQPCFLARKSGTVLSASTVPTSVPLSGARKTSVWSLGQRSTTYRLTAYHS